MCNGDKMLCSCPRENVNCMRINMAKLKMISSKYVIISRCIKLVNSIRGISISTIYSPSHRIIPHSKIKTRLKKKFAYRKETSYPNRKSNQIYLIPTFKSKTSFSLPNAALFHFPSICTPPNFNLVLPKSGSSGNTPSECPSDISSNPILRVVSKMAENDVLCDTPFV